MDKKTILVVEDEILLQNALYDKLTRTEFLALRANNGQEGYEIALQKRPD